MTPYNNTLKLEVPAEAFVQRGEVPAEAFVQRGEVPAEAFVQRQEVPAEAFVLRQKVPAEAFVQRQKVPAEAFVQRQKVPAEAFVQRQKVPAEAFVQRQKVPAEAFVQRQKVPAFARMTREGGALGKVGQAFARMTREGGALVVVVAVVMMIAGCKTVPVKEVVKVEAVKVRVVPVVVQEISLPVRSGGIVGTSEEIKLSFKTGGIVAQTYCNEGDAVKQGQLLAMLNLSEINAQVNQAANGHDKALRDFNRAKNLYADSVATLEQMQNAETALNVSKSILEMAEFNLSHSKIVAPKSGVILRQLVKENELVAPGYPVFALGISGKSWIIRTSLSDRDIVKINIGDSAGVTIDAWPGLLFTAKVSQIGEASNPMTGTYEIELVLNETKSRLASGFIANIEIFPSSKVSYSLIPMASVVEADGRIGYVYSVTPAGTAKKTKVIIATLYGTQAAVSGGLENVKEVVCDGVAYLADGIPLDIKKQ